MYSGEIDLFAAFSAVFKFKLFIFSLAALFGVGAASYVFFSVPEYEVRTLLHPVALNDLHALNQTEVYSLRPEEVLLRVGAALSSYSARLEYFRNHPELLKSFTQPGFTLEQAFDQFNRSSLKLVLPPSAKTDDRFTAFIALEFRYLEGVAGEQVLNDFVRYAIDRERQKISDELAVVTANRISEVDGRLRAARTAYDSDKAGKVAALLEVDSLKRAKLNDELRALRSELKVRRTARIAQLEEAIVIAKSLGLKRPTTPALMADRGSFEGQVILGEVGHQQSPIYVLGTDVLEAERNVLLNRASDDFTDPKIAKIGSELALLKNNREVEVLGERADDEFFLQSVEPLLADRARLANISINTAGLKLVNIDQLAIKPLRPLGPKKLMVIFLGLAVGALVAVILVSVRVFFRFYRHAMAFEGISK